MNRQMRSPVSGSYASTNPLVGANLYTNSIVAINASTGTLQWHFQFTPHDINDWDSNHVPVLADMMWEGELRSVVMMANRNGFFYVLDRRARSHHR